MLKKSSPSLRGERKRPAERQTSATRLCVPRHPSIYIQTSNCMGLNIAGLGRTSFRSMNFSIASSTNSSSSFLQSNEDRSSGLIGWVLHAVRVSFDSTFLSCLSTLISPCSPIGHPVLSCSSPPHAHREAGPVGPHQPLFPPPFGCHGLCPGLIR
jgi:hypothetical protein